MCIRAHDCQQQILIPEQVIGINHPKILFRLTRICRPPELHLGSALLRLYCISGSEMNVEHIREVKLLVPSKNVRKVTAELVIMKINEKVVPPRRLFEEVRNLYCRQISSLSDW